ncbi:MAG: hypothetical protein RBG13Loki_4199 [Promethearchaeota archaeon CR_4]|nr:MAG: hypothetical protein RBG13Loki_4199 [Candidatus Lokiarchaeota archaeon CR_4]
MIVGPNLGNPAVISLGTDTYFEMTLAYNRTHKQKTVERLVRNHIVLENARTHQKYSAKVLEIFPHKISKYSYLRNLAQHNVYGFRDRFFKVRVAIPPVKIAPPRKFELFNITYINPMRNPHTVYHALCVTNQNWENFTFIQATDLHIAKRNDAIFDTIATKKFLHVDLDQPIQSYFEAMDPEIFTNPKLRGVLEFLEYRNRANNFNSALRQFITQANILASQGKLDFVLMTGDLIDFVRISPYSSSLGAERSNFQLFHDFLIGRFQSSPLLVPCFMVPGNHDFRMNHYKLMGMTSLDFAAEYKSFGLTRNEAIFFKQPGVLNPLASSSKALIDYYRYLNPKLDFFKHLGKFHFLFYNSGPDAFLGENSLVDLIGGEPDTTGLLPIQITWLKQYILQHVRSEDKVIAIFHTPPLNFSREYDIHDMLGSTRLGRGATPWISEYRLDVGTISSNRSKFVLTALGEGESHPLDLVLSGHVHRPAEYRVEISNTYSTEREEDRYRVYCDYFSRQLMELGGDSARVREFWQKNRPLFVTSCALGPINSHVREGRVPGYRQFQVKDGQLTNFGQVHRHQQPYIFLSRHRNVTLTVPWRSTIGNNWQDFTGKIEVEISNCEGISRALIFFDVEIRFHGHGIRGYEVDPHLQVKNRFTRGKIMQSPLIAASKKIYHRFFIISNVQHFQWSFRGTCRYGAGPFSGLLGIRLNVRVISVVQRAGEWRVIGDEETSNKVGLSY